MARYLIIPKRLARAVPALENCAQWLETQAIRLLFAIAGVLPLSTAMRIAAGAFGLVGPHTDKAAKARANLAIAFPDRDENWRSLTTRSIFRSLGESAVELLRADQIWREREQRLDFQVHPASSKLFDQDRACIFVTAHVGAWQLTNFIALRENMRISTVYAEESNPKIMALFFSLRQALGVRLIPSSAGVRPLLKELSQGHSIGLALDTRLKSGELIPFFGRAALTNTSAARLALRTGAALLPIRALRTGRGCYRIEVQEPLRCDTALEPEQQALELTRQINAQFEAWIRATPEQWICLKRRWPKAHRL